MKTVFTYLVYLLIILLVGLGSCNDPFITDYSDLDLKSGKGNQIPELSEDEEAHILFLREEEKLAHDVYVEFFETYGHNIFLNISESEQKHMDAMLRLINFYGLEDSASELPGVFNNGVLAQLYEDWMEMVSDYNSALEVGVLIEETEIENISEFMAQTEIKNLLQVYNHLIRGSENHLRSFNKVLDKMEQKEKK